MKVLIIEDDRRIHKHLKSILEGEHFITDSAFTAEEGIDKAIMNEPDLILLDWMLPDQQGDEVCHELRNESIHSPIIFLTAKNQAEDMVDGLNAGADDFLTKPFEDQVLLAHVRAKLRRKQTSTVNPIIEIGKLTVDTNSQTAMVDNCELTLSPREFTLLRYMALNTDRVLERVELLTHVWDEEIDVLSNTVDVHIRYLRKKMEKYNISDYIQTVKGKGYRLCEPSH